LFLAIYIKLLLQNSDFVKQAKKLKPRYMVMITPSRWFTGGKGLDSYREEMLNDRHLLKLVDYQNAKDCFPETSIGGGVSYFLWARDIEDDCQITNKILICTREVKT